VPPLPEELAPHLPQLEILDLLGQGGMGAVYKARQRGLDRLVALKILPPEVNQDETFAERFIREARALARLSHPNIVAVYDFGQSGRNYYLVMEYVDGVNLRQSLQSGGLKPAEALAIVPQICDALQFAHDEGIVHRDIKPENILINKRGRVKIADFGLAKLLGQDHPAPALTATHQVMGTLRYMAPEQMQGSREVDHRADIYALGVVFYELLTGELPIGRFAPPSKKVQVDVRLDEVVLRALEQDPEQRYQHASEVKTDVETISRSPRPADAARPASAGGVSAPVHADRARQSQGEPRVSRFAIAGAVSALIGLLAVISTLLVSDLARYWMPRPTLGFTILIGALLAIGAGAPIGTTIFGVIAIGHIRRSGGKITGLPLAVADALLVPLALLDFLMMAIVAGVVMAVLFAVYPDGPRGDVARNLPPILTLIIAVPLAAWIDFLIVRRVWRAVVGQRDEAVPHSLGNDPGRRYQHASDVKLEVESIGRGPAPPPVPVPIPVPAASSEQAAKHVDVESARRQVRGPAVGLFWTGLLTVTMGVLVVLWSGWTLERIEAAPQEKSPQSQGATTVTITPQLGRFPSRPLLWLLLIEQAAAVAAGGILIQAALLMARLQDYSLVSRWGVLAKLPISPVWLLGLPLSLRCQAVLSRPEIRDAFDRPGSPAEAGADGESPFGAGLFPKPFSGTTWATLIVSLAGTLATFLPWLRLNLGGFDVSLPGYDGWYGIVTGAVFLAAFLVRVLAELKPIDKIWRVGASLGAAVSAIALTSAFLYEVAHPQLSSSASGDIAGDSKLAQSLQALLIEQLHEILRYSLHVGSFVALACGIVLLGLATFEALHRSAEGGQAVSDWQAWWLARPLTLRKIVRGGLLVVYLAAMVIFISFSVTFRGTDSHHGIRKEIGSPFPWFTAYKNEISKDNVLSVEMGSHLNLLSPSWLILATGACAYWAWWKLRRVEGQVSRWDSPRIHFLVWTIAVIIDISISLGPFFS
jgi:predicted Ser/Thr protein kinase